jgi:hypothetical protein
MQTDVLERQELIALCMAIFEDKPPSRAGGAFAGAIESTQQNPITAGSGSPSPSSFGEHVAPLEIVMDQPAKVTSQESRKRSSVNVGEIGQTRMFNHHVRGASRNKKRIPPMKNGFARGGSTIQHTTGIQDKYANELEWTPPNSSLQKVYQATTHPRDPYTGLAFNSKMKLGRHCPVKGCISHCDAFGEGAVSDLQVFGSGVSNYFKFIKTMGWTLFLMFLINSPAVVLNASGSYVASGDSSSQALAYLAIPTVGNLGNSYDNSTEFVTLPFCNAEGRQFRNGSRFEFLNDCTLHKSSVARIYSYLDCLGILVFTCAWLWLSHWEGVEAEKVDKNNTTASDFTIYLPWVPKDCTESDLKKHFERVTELRPGERLQGYGTEYADGHLFKVEVVHFGEDNGALIDMYKARGKLVQTRNRESARILFLASCKAGDADYHDGKAHTAAFYDSKTKAAKAKRRDLELKIGEMTRRRAMLPRGEEAKVAFITFKEELGVVRALELYPSSFFRVMLQPQALRLKLKGGGGELHKIRVRRAPEPSAVIWENLEISGRRRRIRRVASFMLALCLLLVSVSLAYAAKTYAIKQGSENCNLEATDIALNTTALGTNTTCSFDVKEARKEAQADKARIPCFCKKLSTSQMLTENLCYKLVFALQVPTYLPTCLPMYLPTYLPSSCPTAAPAPSSPPSSVSSHTYLPHLPAYLPTYLPTFLPTYLPANLPLLCYVSLCSLPLQTNRFAPTLTAVCRRVFALGRCRTC